MNMTPAAVLVFWYSVKLLHVSVLDVLCMCPPVSPLCTPLTKSGWARAHPCPMVSVPMDWWSTVDYSQLTFLPSSKSQDTKTRTNWTNLA